jgi:imidazolonepropionase-like amidohydrolase
MMLRRTATAAAAISAGLMAAAPATADAVLIAPAAIMPDGTIREDVGVLIGDDGVIRRVTAAAELADHPRARRLPEGSVLSPGMIDLASAVGAWQANASDGASIDPDASVIDGFDPLAADVRTVLQAGITAVMLAPSMNGLVDGTCATVRTHPKDDGSADVLSAHCAMAMTMGEPAFGTALGPFSRAGSMAVLRETFRTAGDAPDSRLGRVASGDLPVVALVSEPEDASAMLRLLGRQGITPTLVHTVDAIDIAEEAGDAEANVIVGPYSMDSDRRVLVGAAALADAGATVAFRGGLPAAAPDRLRLTAALAVAHGLDPAAARRGLTSSAASIAGVGDRIGAIAAGRQADLVIFSGDPLRLDSRVLEVHVAGRRVAAAH